MVPSDPSNLEEASGSRVAEQQRNKDYQALPKKLQILFWTGISASFFAAWLLFVWPAISNEWWAIDDYYLLGDFHTLTQFGHLQLTMGRPFAVLWSLMSRLVFSMAPSLFHAGVIVRMIQGILHVCCTVFAGSVLWRFTKNPWSMLALLPFLLSPMTGEATTWIAAGPYPLAGFLSVLGIRLCIQGKRYLWMGMGIILISTLTNQSGCMIGLIIYWICMMLASQNRGWWQETRISTLSIVFAYVIGALFNAAIGTWSQDERLIGLTNFSFQTSEELIRLSGKLLLTEPAFYPLWLRTIQIIALLVPITWIILETSIHSTIIGTLRRNGILLIGFAGLFFLPYIPLLPMGTVWLAGRVMYTAPLVFTGALLLSLQARHWHRIPVIIAFCLLAIQIIGYYPISRTYAQGHSLVYQNDVRTLKELETAASRAGTTSLVISAVPQRQVLLNPYHLPYAWFGDSQRSALGDSQYAQLFVPLYSSSISLSKDPRANSDCLAFCMANGILQRETTILLTPTRTLCFCA